MSHGRHDDCVDHMDDAVIGGHVGLRDIGVIHLWPAFEREGHFVSFDGGRGHALGQVASHALGQFARSNIARHDMVGENGDQLIPVLLEQQVVERAFGKRGERFIGGQKP